MATIKDIAEKSGVSIGTVDRIIHNRGRFSEKTADKVRKVMKELNYKPNPAASALSRSTPKVFVIIIPTLSQDSGYWKLVYKGIQDSLEYYERMNLKAEFIFYDRYNQNSFNQAFDKAYSLNPDGLALVPSIPDIASERLKEAKCKYVIFDNQLPDDKNKISYIGQDSYKSGKLAGKLMEMALHKNFSNPFKILAIRPSSQNFHLKQRIQGFCDYIIDTTKTAPLELQLKDSEDIVEYNIQLENIFKENKDINGIFIADSSPHIICDYLKKHPLTSRPIIIGYDSVPKNIKYLETSDIEFVISQQPEIQGNMIIEHLFQNILCKEDVNPVFYTRLEIITKENI
jgi:LacI family transcriptional regulator